MGCISSKLLPPGPGEARGGSGGAHATVRGRVDHVVSLTSTTYGVLDLHPKHGAAAAAAAAAAAGQKKGEETQPPQEDKPISREWKRARPPPLVVPGSAKKPAPAALVVPGSAKKKAPAGKVDSGLEVINAWEIMAGLEDADAADGSPPAKKQAKQPSRWSPARVLAMALPSPKKSATKKRNTPGKENSPMQRCSGNNTNNKTGEVDVDRILRPYNSIDNSKLLRASKRFSPASARIVRKPGPPETGGGGGGMSSSRRSLSPLFDPELLASIERELSEEGAHIKRMVGSEKPKHPKAAPPAMVAEGKCPPGGADAVVLYTTTLRGIRRTFEECNAVRAAIEAHDVKVIERDVSMDSGYREELRLLLGGGGKGVRVPAVFVRGRHVGGAAEVSKLEEEGKLKALLQGLPRARVWCAGCAGVRFVMCRDCNGSRKVRVDDGERKKETVQCGECNENGLVRCPICS
uniref:Glutaredoxin domain-containing protein n=1 Tax=Leersia perrieri TaxID=77586 RepID=A0A0D9W4N7_9ORYZ